jgi:hypothetical protein
VNTDGCSYRRDQVPACPLAECLRLCPDYAVRRPEAGSGVPFLDPAEIPDDDAGFTEWYRGHARRFFGDPGGGFDALVASHDWEHKRAGAGGQAAFDALACDGCANYLKASGDGAGGWRVDEFAARGYGRESKAAIQGWVVRAYARDRVTGPAPVAEDTVLLHLKEADLRARSALRAGLPAVIHPLGLSVRKVRNYKAVKLSAFVFATPEQRRAVERQVARFEERTGCGLDLLALRRSYAGRREGSLADLTEEVYQMIRQGRHDLVKRLNMTRLLAGLAEVSRARLAEVEARRGAAGAALYEAIDVDKVSPEALRTGRVVGSAGRPGATPSG